MQCICEGHRSSVFLDSGTVYRVYHDTGRKVPVPYHIDTRGLPKVRKGPVARGSSYRGGSSVMSPCLRRTEQLLDQFDRTTISDFASLTGTKVNTLWSYLCCVAEGVPSRREAILSKFVYLPLVSALNRVDVSGSLREVMERVNEGPLRGDSDWRCVEDRFSQLRLARICMTTPTPSAPSDF